MYVDDVCYVWFAEIPWNVNYLLFPIERDKLNKRRQQEREKKNAKRMEDGHEMTSDDDLKERDDVFKFIFA